MFLTLVVVVFLPVALGSCAPGSCTTAPALACTPSVAGVQCAECGWQGWLASNGSCLQNSPPLPSSCPCTSMLNECIPASYGSRCAECNYRGFVDDQGACECYDVLWDPNSGCSSWIENQPTATLELTAVGERAACQSFQSRTLGFYRAVEQGVYGGPSPGVPVACYSELYGPPIGQLVELVPPWQECNTFGAFNPDEAGGNFRTCSGHGDWNPTRYTCECDSPWNAIPIGLDFDNEMAYTCGECFGFWGPRPPPEPLLETTRLFCSAPYLPDEDGVRAPCAGHGDWDGSQCICYASQEQGFWGLETVEQTFERTLGNGSVVLEQQSVSVCRVCANGKPVSSGCTSPNPDQPIVEPPTPPTLPPAPSCGSCASFGNTELQGAGLLDPTSVAHLTTSCCTVEYYETTATSIDVYNGTCVDGEEKRRHLASRWCQYLTGCETYEVMTERDFFVFRFTAEADPLRRLNAIYESGRVCAPTPAPIQPSTPYPTIF